MYAVIFTAEIAEIDEQYFSMAKKMRDKAISEYNCIEFTSVCEGGQEIAISYWPDRGSIRLWKEDAEHLVAQNLGIRKWYQSYAVKVVKVEHQYQNG